MKKKICIFTSAGRDNFEVVIYRQAKVLQDNGYDVCFLVSDEKEEETYENIRVLSTGHSTGNYLKRIFILPFTIYNKLKIINADAYQTACPELIILCLLLKIRGKKVVFNLREHHPYYFYEKSKLPIIIKRLIVSIMALWMKCTLKKMDGIVTVSDGIEDYLKKWGIKKILNVGNYPFYREDYSLTFEDYSARPDCLLYFGSIRANSRQENILQGVKNITGLRYLVAGVFTSNEYKEQMVTSDLWKKHVEFIEGFEHSELDSFIDRSTISNVVRDFSDCVGAQDGSMGVIKLTESMEAGLPIICTDLPLYRKMMQDYKCGILVDPQNPAQIEDALKYLVNNKKEAWEMGQNGRKAIKEKYSWNYHSQFYVQLFNKLFIV